MKLSHFIFILTAAITSPSIMLNSMDIEKPHVQKQKIIWCTCSKTSKNLVHATQNKCYPCCKNALKKGVNVNEMNNQWTPLTRAAYDGSKDLIELFLEYKADINQVDYNSLAPIHWAAYRGNIEIIKVLLDKGANINAQCGVYKWTALHIAVNCEHQEVVKILVERNASTELTDSCGRTANMLGYEKHKDINIVHINKTANHLYHSKQLFSNMKIIKNALKHDGKEILDFFLKKYDINIKDEDGNSLLHLTLLHGKDKETIARYLILQKIDVKITNNAGKTAYDIATENNLESIKNLIQSKCPKKKDPTNNIPTQSTSFLEGNSGCLPNSNVHDFTEEFSRLTISEDQTINSEQSSTHITSETSTPLVSLEQHDSLPLATHMPNFSLPNSLRLDITTLCLCERPQSSIVDAINNACFACFDCACEGSKYINQTQGQIPNIHSIIKNKVLKNSLKVLWIKALLRKGANINFIDSDGNTPLHIALLEENILVALQLIRMKARFDIKNYEQKAAYDMVSDLTSTNTAWNNCFELMNNMLLFVDNENQN